MGDQDKETQSTKTSTLNQIEEKQQKVIAKIKELFEKENFKKNTHLTRFIVNTTTNAVHLNGVLSEKSVQEISVDHKLLDEILKKDELKDVIKYSPQELTVAPTWKKLRNILYIKNIDKDLKNELQQLIEQDIKPHTIYYKSEQQNIVDSIKITINEPNQEENITKALFDKLFFKKYTIGEKEVTIDCSIEEEQFTAPAQQPHPQQHPNHTFRVSRDNYPTTIDPRQQQQLQQQQMIIMNQMLMQMQKQSRNMQFQKNNRQQQNQNGRQYVNKNVNNLNNNTKSSGNNLYQPSSNSNRSMNKQDRNHKGGKNHKGGNRQNSKQGQKVFNATDKDFPSLQ
ncbi:hypothetical protein TTHERM_00773720 (macronuclear) [Tetrahymena thermophila SB210]|uniref:Uncharacterized protein n=1 Tax=Tetrahymena thermophila (strain SB210) TaxID=312017 RepID=I7LSZ6_TETTS|nr:hypothetical protein TTHERM_00773720 [Tetrahymena thermophila SB210]EAR83962.3 hypothetical protein TTHERM_00773720 [Tetrahymena thermophila SB210]|eukprot:XP_001031625.3 hypothetical protein TTHERM_00773720 [Tetrahymena thermophila SB210]